MTVIELIETLQWILPHKANYEVKIESSGKEYRPSEVSHITASEKNKVVILTDFVSDCYPSYYEDEKEIKNEPQS